MMLSAYRGFVLASLFVALLASGCTWLNRSREPASERGVINSAGADVTFANDQKKARDEAAAKAASSASDSAEGSGGAVEPAAGGATATPLPADSDSTGADGGSAGAGGAMADRDAGAADQGADTSGGAATGRVGPEGGNDAMMEKVTLQGDALFQFGKADEKGMLPGGKQRLDELADKIMAMDAGTIASIMIVGHADRLGSATGNMKISEKRAATVMNYLVRRGVDAATMESMGKGDADPVTDCPGALADKALIACLSPNRRVEVMINAK